MTVTVLGVEKLLATFAAKQVLADVALGAGVDEMGREVLDEARQLVPVLTGTLRDSLTYQDGRVSTDVVYAGEVEYGGLHNPPEPYLRPAADTVNPEQSAAAMKAVLDSG